MQSHHKAVPEKEVSQPKSNFSQGAFVLSRSDFSSEMWTSKSAEYAKLYVYLIGKAAHSGRSYDGYTLRIGELFTNYTNLSAQIAYLKGFCVVKPSDRFVKKILKYFVEEKFIAIEKKPRGLLIRILDYKDIQALDNYKKKVTTDGVVLKIFEYWNKMEIIQSVLDKKFVSAIKKRLKDYTAPEIMQAMSNYSAILRSDDHYFTNRMPLDRFLSHSGGLESFLSVNDPFGNFKKNAAKGSNCNDPQNEGVIE